ncbi:hypothetical protein [Sphingomonas fennica]|uniref:hypothetical protein n=1 Tax=Edaphosphingomonas fennica TaxID=114404 RepID=UPI0011B1FE2A|nr:hypothetical protein [Sphingomonas fennica]
MTRFSASLLIASSLLAGCATIRTTPYREQTVEAGDALPGLTYRLPMAQYELTIVRTLAECPGGMIEGKPTSLKFSTDVAAEKSYVPGEAYMLDPRLTGFLKTSSLEMNYYPNGTLKSIGVAAEDRTGQVVENAAKIAAAGVMLAAGVPPVAVVAGAGAAAIPPTSGDANVLSNKSSNFKLQPIGPTQVICTDEAKQNLKTLTDADKAIKEETKALIGANKAMEELTEELRLKLKTPRQAKGRWQAILLEQRRANAAIEGAKDSKAKALEALSVKEIARWPEHYGEAGRQQDLPLGNSAREKLEKLVTMGTAQRVVPVGGVDMSALSSEIRALAGMKAVSPFGNSTTKAQSTDLAAELASAARQSTPTVPAECLGSSTLKACLEHHLELHLAVRTEWPLAKDCAAGAPNDAECLHKRLTDEAVDDLDKAYRIRHARDTAYDEGVFIREPAQGKLLVCRKALATDVGCALEDDLAEVEAANFPQLGQLRFLKFKVPMFQAKDLGVFLSADGRLERYYLKSTKAALETATASAANAATTMADAMEKRETERRSDLEYAQSEKSKALTAQIAELENAEKLRKLQQPPSSDPLKPLREAAAENEAHIAQLQSQLAREQLEAALNSGDDAAARALLAILKEQ